MENNRAATFQLITRSFKYEIYKSIVVVLFLFLHFHHLKLAQSMPLLGKYNMYLDGSSNDKYETIHIASLTPSAVRYEINMKSL